MHYYAAWRPRNDPKDSPGSKHGPTNTALGLDNISRPIQAIRTVSALYPGMDPPIIPLCSVPNIWHMLVIFELDWQSVGPASPHLIETLLMVAPLISLDGLASISWASTLTEAQSAWQKHSQTDRSTVKMTDPQSDWQIYWQNHSQT